MRRSRRNLLAAFVVAGVVALGGRASAQSLVSFSEFGSPGNDSVNGIASRNGVVVVAGTVAGPLDGQAFLGGYSDGFVRAYNAAGQRLWTRLIGTAGDDGIQDVAFDAAGSISPARRWVAWHQRTTREVPRVR